MIKAGTLCIVIWSRTGEHAGHLAMTVGDSVFRYGHRDGKFFPPELRNEIACSCGEVDVMSPTRWLRPLPPLSETEPIAEEVEA